MNGKPMMIKAGSRLNNKLFDCYHEFINSFENYDTKVKVDCVFKSAFHDPPQQFLNEIEGLIQLIEHFSHLWEGVLYIDFLNNSPLHCVMYFRTNTPINLTKILTPFLSSNECIQYYDLEKYNFDPKKPDILPF